MKKTFIFYSDRQDYLSEFTDAEVGIFLKTILKYQRGEDVGDMGNIKFIRNRVKNQLDDDNSKWEKEKIAKSKAGIDGNKKRWGDRTPSQSIAPAITGSQSIAPISQSIAPIAVNVNVNDNVNDNVYEYDNVYSEKENKILEIYESGFEKMDKEFYLRKLKLLSEHLINLGFYEITNSIEKVGEDDNGNPIYRSTGHKKANYQIAVEKALSIVDGKGKYNVKDFWATLNNRIKKDLSSKK